MPEQKIRPIAVLISDIHYTLATLEVADAAMNQAVAKANRLYVPLIVCGDLHDTKANLRAECVKAIITTLKKCRIHPYVLVGNHDKVNERSTEHALEFLQDTAEVVIKPGKFDIVLDSYEGLLGYLIPYHSDSEALEAYIKTIPKGSRIIMHQGVKGALTGEYIVDHSAIDLELLKDYQVISGHYHYRQKIGTVQYLGNPYTLTFGEANDPSKGFHVLYNNGDLQFIPTNLRRHIIKDLHIDDLGTPILEVHSAPHDLVLVKLRGPSDKLQVIDKNSIAKSLEIAGDFRLDLIPDETMTLSSRLKNEPDVQVLDNLIDSLTNTDEDRKQRLRLLWRNLISNENS